MFKKLLLALSIISTHAYGGLVGSNISLRTLGQATASSTPAVTSFPNTVLVSQSEIEYPNVASLFNPTSPSIPGFARSLVNVAIDAGDNFITLDFKNAGSGRFASSYQNTYIFKFLNPNAITFASASINRSATTLGLSDSDVLFSGDELFINVESLSFVPSTFVKIDLTSNGGTLPVPEPASYILAFFGALVASRIVKRN
jgi:hypothetical protein